MSIPYTKTVEAVCVSGVRNCIVIPLPTRGILTRLIVKQVSGPEEGFAFDLFDRQQACQYYGSLSESEGHVGELSPDLYKLQPTQSVLADANLSEQYQLALPYVNQDDQNVGSRRPTGALYLSILPAGTGAKQFEAAATVAQPEMT